MTPRRVGQNQRRHSERQKSETGRCFDTQNAHERLRQFVNESDWQPGELGIALNICAHGVMRRTRTHLLIDQRVLRTWEMKRGISVLEIYAFCFAMTTRKRSQNAVRLPGADWLGNIG